MAKMTNYYSDDWCIGNCATSQKELQEIAGKIRKTCKVTTIEHLDGYVCTIYVNENMGLRYWIKDEFGVISEINEERNN